LMLRPAYSRLRRDPHCCHNLEIGLAPAFVSSLPGTFQWSSSSSRFRVLVLLMRALHSVKFNDKAGTLR
jgi:hypothetical protein